MALHMMKRTCSSSEMSTSEECTCACKNTILLMHYTYKDSYSFAGAGR